MHLALRNDRLHPVPVAVAAQFIAVVALVCHDIAAALSGPAHVSR